MRLTTYVPSSETSTHAKLILRGHRSGRVDGSVPDLGRSKSLDMIRYANPESLVVVVPNAGKL